MNYQCDLKTWIHKLSLILSLKKIISSRKKVANLFYVLTKACRFWSCIKDLNTLHFMSNGTKSICKFYNFYVYVIKRFTFCVIKGQN